MCSRLDKVKLMKTTDARVNEISEGSERSSLTYPLNIHRNELGELRFIKDWLWGESRSQLNSEVFFWTWEV